MQEGGNGSPPDISKILSALDSSQIGYIEFSLEGNILYASDSYLELFKLDRHQIVGQNQKLFVEPDVKLTFAYQLFWDGVRSGKFQSGDFERIDAHGDKLFLHERYSIICNDQGKPEKIGMFAFPKYGTIHNVDLFQRHINSSNYWILFVSIDETLLAFNTMAENEAKTKMNQPLKKGKTLNSVFNTDYVTLAIDTGFKKALNGESHFIEIRMDLAGQDDLTWYRVHFDPILDNRKKLEAVSITIRSIEREIQANQKIKLQNEQLQKIAFVNGHGVRAPLATLLGLVNLIELEKSSDIQVLISLNAKIRKAANELDDVIRSVSTLANE